MELEQNLAKELLVHMEYSKGLRTQSCGLQVLRMTLANVSLLILTDSGPKVKKSRLQLKKGLLSARSRSLGMNLVGIMVLKVKL